MSTQRNEVTTSEAGVNDGGPAFPLQSIGPDFAHGYAGMPLRDYFAAKAMQASRARGSQYATWEDLAKDAYEIADAMLAAREAKS